MSDDVDALVAWLRAQWDADEQVAREATDGPWAASGHSVLAVEDIEIADVPRRDAAHFARHDPRDTLARIQAERAILSGYERTAREVEDVGLDIYDREGNRRRGALAALENALYALAYGYRHRAGWQDGWAP